MCTILIWRILKGYSNESLVEKAALSRLMTTMTRDGNGSLPWHFVSSMVFVCLTLEIDFIDHFIHDYGGGVLISLGFPWSSHSMIHFFLSPLYVWETFSLVLRSSKTFFTTWLYFSGISCFSSLWMPSLFLKQSYFIIYLTCITSYYSRLNWRIKHSCFQTWMMMKGLKNVQLKDSRHEAAQ